MAGMFLKSMLVVGTASAVAGSMAGMHEGIQAADLIHEKTTVQTFVDVAPELRSVEFFADTRFMQIVGAAATTAYVKNTWTMKLGDIALPSVTATTKSVYNAKLKAAREKGTVIDDKDIDFITVDGLLGPDVKEEYRDTTRMADRSETDKNKPPILTYHVEAKDLIFIPEVNPDTFSQSGAFVTTADGMAQIIGAPDQIKANFGGDEQTYAENTGNLARNNAYSTAIRLVMDKCGPELIVSPQTSPLVIGAIKRVAVKNYNATHPADEAITEDDVAVTIGKIGATYKSPWSEKQDKIIAEKRAAAPDNSLDIPDVSVDVRAANCTISEADFNVLNGSK